MSNVPWPVATSTHRALMCQEIVDNICEFLDPYRREKFHREQGKKASISKRALKELACTCKAFSDPALRVLWRRLRDISDLLQLLPQYVPLRPSEAFSLEFDRVRQLLSDEPADHDWERLRSYAVRVRVLEYGSWRPVDDASLEILSKKCNGEPLLPRLDNLQLSFDFGLPRISNLGLLIQLLVPTSLRYLKLSGNGYGTTQDHQRQYQELFQDIVSRAPHLRHLSFRGDVDQCSYLYPIKALRDVQKLSFDCNYLIDTTILAYCASLPSLRELSCRINTRATKYPDIRGAFELLSRISICGSAEDVVWFFKEISVTNLYDITLFLDRATDMDELLRLLSEVLTLFTPTLRKLYVEIDIESSELLPLVVAIEPLLNLRSLESFTMESTSPIAISPDDLMRMASAWPDIIALHIYDRSSSSTASVLPAQVLEHIALRFPRLESLKLPRLDLTQLPPQAQEPVLDHGLVDLQFLPSRPRRDGEEHSQDSLGHDIWLNAAVFVDRLFPRLDLNGNAIIAERKGGRKFANFLSALRCGRERAEALDKLRVDVGEEPYFLDSIIL
ncbi:hypothetical protein L226DRAFT_160601 [Lentinus tigrinus ALCF2SS1-7]|uniref:F-box domain-containing protein n=1 Tax=Lentinus tigrinus ALCF2SS1-6 TaxID=1328759 RepID=A0A5C2S1T7_9APHY|nr:hypothetical protein L227DRAFT_655509 [Lentinus tigrinus ALCF2SS1-6]RPD72020.1 hypothetical protein L226DRAFT_160601 [Lentinus tigrinus ALCF2SS1-7]